MNGVVFQIVEAWKVGGRVRDFLGVLRAKSAKHARRTGAAGHLLPAGGLHTHVRRSPATPKATGREDVLHAAHRLDWY